jgi:hypothetical protein
MEFSFDGMAAGAIPERGPAVLRKQRTAGVISTQRGRGGDKEGFANGTSAVGTDGRSPILTSPVSDVVCRIDGVSYSGSGGFLETGSATSR